jgi:hypothetical protein
MMSEEEVQKKIAEAVIKARGEQMLKDFGETWFREALAHTAGMVNRGEFPRPAHEAGQIFYQQFLINTGDGQPAKKEPAAEEKKPGE